MMWLIHGARYSGQTTMKLKNLSMPNRIGATTNPVRSSRYACDDGSRTSMPRFPLTIASPPFCNSPVCYWILDTGRVSARRCFLWHTYDRTLGAQAARPFRLAAAHRRRASARRGEILGSHFIGSLLPTHVGHKRYPPAA